eukprot:3941305-Rhodomonas_salina.5
MHQNFNIQKTAGFRDISLNFHIVRARRSFPLARSLSLFLWLPCRRDTLRAPQKTAETIADVCVCPVCRSVPVCVRVRVGGCVCVASRSRTRRKSSPATRMSASSSSSSAPWPSSRTSRRTSATSSSAKRPRARRSPSISAGCSPRSSRASRARRCVLDSPRAAMHAQCNMQCARDAGCTHTRTREACDGVRLAWTDAVASDPGLTTCIA